jgi:hypothetical protein
MSQELIGKDWGATLDDESFACALAWLLTHGKLEGRYPRRERGSRLLLAGPDWWRAKSAITAENAAQRWRSRTKGLLPLRIGLKAKDVPRELDPIWLARALRPAIQSVFFIDSSAGHRSLATALRRGRPPFRIAFLDRQPSTALHHQLARTLDADMVRLVRIDDDEPIDLVIGSKTIEDARDHLSRMAKRSQIYAVLAFQGATGSAAVDELVGLRRAADARAAALVGVPSPTREEWISSLLFGWFAGDFDDALFHAGDAAPILVMDGAGAEAERPWPTKALAFEASRRLDAFDRFKPRAEVTHDDVADTSVRDDDSGAADAPPRPVRRITRSRPTRGGRRVRAKPPERRVDAVDAVEATEAAEPVERRVLQARLCAAGKDESVNDEALQHGAEYRLDVLIARPKGGWVSAAVAFPSDQLTPSADGHWLDVVLVASDVLEEPLRERLLLPAHDDSKPCSFALTIPANLARLSARVTVLYQNRILQTVRITAPIGQKARDDLGLQVSLEAVLRASLEDVDQTSGFDVALLFNDSEGVPGLTAFGGDEAAYVNLDGIEDLRKSLRAALETITRTPKAFQDPTSKETRTLYLTLARAGRGFLNALSELPRMEGVLGRLGSSGRLQVTSLHPDDLTPLELVYEGPFPNKKAQLCPALLARRACDGTCIASEDVVCGSQFWGIRHIIERRLFDEHATLELQKQGAIHAFQVEARADRPVLNAVQTVLFGAADRAAAFDRGSFTTTVQEIESMLTGANAQLVQVNGWEGWSQQVAARAPQLLLLIGHTEPILGAIELEIGEEQDSLAAAEIKHAHVRVGPPDSPNPGPIVLLFGCRTAVEEIPFSSFIAAFRRARASVIIGTLSTVLGRHMAPVAQRTLALLLERSTGAGTSVGEVLRELRRALVADALPVGLALVSFGESDWRLGGEA